MLSYKIFEDTLISARHPVYFSSIFEDEEGRHVLDFVSLSYHITLFDIHQIKLHLGVFLRQSVESSTHTFAGCIVLSEVYDDNRVSSCPCLDSFSESCTIIQISKHSSVVLLLRNTTACNLTTRLFLCSWVFCCRT